MKIDYPMCEKFFNSKYYNADKIKLDNNFVVHLECESEMVCSLQVFERMIEHKENHSGCKLFQQFLDNKCSEILKKDLCDQRNRLYKIIDDIKQEEQEIIESYNNKIEFPSDTQKMIYCCEKLNDKNFGIIALFVAKKTYTMITDEKLRDYANRMIKATMDLSENNNETNNNKWGELRHEWSTNWCTAPMGSSNKLLITAIIWIAVYVACDDGKMRDGVFFKLMNLFLIFISDDKFEEKSKNLTNDFAKSITDYANNLTNGASNDH